MDKHELPEQAASQNPENQSVDFSDLGPLFSADHSEEKNPSPVDFSDLGPLFDGSQEPTAPQGNNYTPRFGKEDARSEEEASSADDQQPPYSPLFAQAQEEEENTDEALSHAEASQVPYNPLFVKEQETEDADEEPSPAEASQARYTPLFAQEEEPPHAHSQDEPEEIYPPHPEEESAEEEAAAFSPVLPGEAAWLLKKLNELPRESSEAAPQAPADCPITQQDQVSAPQEIPVSEEAVFQEPLPEADIPEEVLSEEAEMPPQAPEQDALSPEPSQEDEIPEPSQEESDLAPVQAQEEDSLQEPAPDPTEPAKLPSPKNRPIKKGRPKRKKGEGFFGIPNLLVTAVWIGITILIGVTLGRMIWVCAADVLAFGRDDQPVTITIYEADTIDDITRKLHEGHLIRYPGLFKLYASLAVDDDEIQPGIWDLNTRYDYHALVSMMSPSSSRDVVEVMIPEGYSCRQIFALLEEKKICTAMDLSSYAANGELDNYWFLEGVARGESNCLEGFLFPDTYQFYKNDSPRSVLQKMLSNFETRFDESMQAQIGTLNDHLASLMRKGGHGEDYIASHRFGIREVINVASLIEKETSSAEEGYTIASVIYNRLFNWGDNIPYLNIDATIIYALGGKTTLTQEDLKVDSPYNTYTNTGLTPGPIANPGLSSIRAALEPAESDYYYYVLDPAQGSHRFSTTYDEHKANIASIGG